jgi:hypothetical protein
MMPKFHGMRNCLDMYISILVLFKSRMMLEILLVNDLFYVKRPRKKLESPKIPCGFQRFLERLDKFLPPKINP